MKGHLLLILGGYAAILAAGQMLFKLAGQGISLKAGVLHFAIKLMTNPIFILGCILYAFATFLWVALLSQFQISTAYPLVTAFSILITVTSGILLFGERLSLSSLIGILFISIGVAVLSQSTD